MRTPAQSQCRSGVQPAPILAIQHNNDGLGKIAERYLEKGAKVYLEGKLTTRKWQDQSGADRYSTEIHLTPFNGVLTFLDNKRDGTRPAGGEPAGPTGPGTDPDDEIPF